MESKTVLNNICVTNFTAWVNELTVWYDKISNYIYILENTDKADQLAKDINERTTIVNDINIALAQAAEINKKVEGQYAKVRDLVNKALEENTREVTIVAVDKDYGGCAVPTEEAQAILDEMQDQKNKAEIMADYIFQVYNDILVARFGDIFKPIEKSINTHCVEDLQYHVRKTAYDKVLVPMTKKLFEHQGRDESELHYKMRKWLRNNGAIYATDSLQTFTDAIYEIILNDNTMYNAFMYGGDIYSVVAKSDIIKRNMIADNCYKTLTESEYNWVIREIGVRLKKDSVDVYKIPNKTTHFERITTLLTRLLFGYGYTNRQGVSEYIKETKNLINDIDIHDMKLLTAIPETCIFTFPTDKKSEYIQTVTTEVIQHCVDYNQNWDLDSAYMYWFWTYLQGRDYSSTKDPTGVNREVPNPHPEPFDYFNTVFKPKLRKIAEVTGNRLFSENGILIDSTYDHASLKLIAPWLVTFFPENTTDPSKRNWYIETLINQAKTFTDVRLFVDWIHDNILLKVPIEVIKSFNAISGQIYLTKVPFTFVPNNFSFFDKEYEFETGYLTVLNSMYWLYGYISDNSGQQLTSRPSFQSQLSYRNQGGMCYQPGINPAKFSVTRYEPFQLIWNPSYNGPVYYKRKESPLTDLSLIQIGKYWYYNWSTAKHTYLVQNLGPNPRPIGVDERIPYIGANCIMLPYKSFILDKIVKTYITKGTECQYNEYYNQNPWLFTFADYVKDNYVMSQNLVELTFNHIIKRLLRCHISFPYNTILNTSFINSVHFNWAGKDAPKDSSDKKWNEVILPQYIFSSSSVESKFNTIGLQKVKMGDAPDLVTLTKYNAINFDLRQCGYDGLGDLPLNTVSKYMQTNAEKKTQKK
mgnify:CR=1 FL=1